MVEVARDSRIRDPETTLEKLFEAALPVLAQAGYERATVDRIVEAAGVSKGAFYTHFASKEELFVAILERRLALNLTRVKELCRLQGSAAEWLLNVLDTLLNFSVEIKDWRSLSIEFMAHGMRNPSIGERITSMHANWRRMFAETLRETDAFKHGRMVASPEAIATTLVAMIDGFIVQVGMDGDPAAKERLMQQIEPLVRAWFKEEG
jgi:AcrR family transcriptional regulator